MNRKRLAIPVWGVLCTLAAGCGGKAKETGFLTDYSHLKRDGSALRYVDQAALAECDRFIVDPVAVRIQGRAKKIDPATVRRLANMLRAEVTSQLIAGDYKIVVTPGPGTARIRMAITDLAEDATALDVLPETRLVGLGLGGAAMEGEILESETDRSIAAMVQAGSGEFLSLEEYAKWSSAESTLKKWAGKLRAEIDRAHQAARR